MTLDDFARVASSALRSIDTLLKSWLPNGRIDGAEYLIGSKAGEAGDSMRIRMTGNRAGYWSDFATEDAGRDLVSLYAYIFGMSQGKACAAVAEEIGITLADNPNYRGNKSSTAPARTNTAPALALEGGKDQVEKKPRTEWSPILPVPDGAGPYPVAHVKRGKPEKIWEYRDQDRQLLGVIYRFKTSDGGKEVLPCVYAEHPTSGARDWRWMQFREPRPLYIPAPLRPGHVVLIVEGEKCADAAHQMLGESLDVVSWPGGGKAVDKCDWSPLAGRNVILWPDADAKRYKNGHVQAGEMMPEHEQPGMRTMVRLSSILMNLDCSLRVVDIPAPGEKPDGWDIADMLDEGASTEEIHARLTRLRPVSAPESDDDVPQWVTAPDDPDGTSTPPHAGAGNVNKDWKRALRMKMIPTGNGGIKGCRENVFMALQDDPRLKGLVALDQFSQLQVKRRPPPWQSEKGEWTEGDDFHLGMYLAKEFGLVIASVGDIEKAVAQAAREHAFNPVIEYMDACANAWDGESRVEQALSTYWGAKDCEYMRTVSRMFFVGMVKRAYLPGCKHDCAPVFEGGQGVGKSSALSIIGGEWFADTPFKMGEKDGYLAIQGTLIYEIAELEQFNRSETTAIKAFMSSTVDRYREPYGRRLKNVPRRTVFAATTNEGEYFKDTTGNRRFWPVEVGQIDLAGIRRDRGQLIGEAVQMMRDGALWYPTPDEQTRLINAEQEKREIADPWLGRIYDYLEGKDAEGMPSAASKKNSVTARELLVRALHIEIGRLGAAKQETMRIAACMRKLGWSKKRETEGARERYYERPNGSSVVAAEGDGYVPF